MKFLSYKNGGRTGLAVQENGSGFVGFLEGDAGYPGSLDWLIDSPETQRRDAVQALLKGTSVDPAAVEVLPPLAFSRKIICVGLNYREHANESGMSIPEHPTLFARFSSNLIGAGRPILRPSESEQLDYEGELVAVIGKQGRRIAKSDALDYVFGYSIFNDGSIRDFQLRTNQWTFGKNFDNTGSFGPTLVTADELPPGARGLKIETRLNGQVMQSSSTDDLIFDVADLVSLISVGMTLLPGDLIVTGTPSGVGAARKPPVFMTPGDVCEVEIERLGILRNPVAQDMA